MDRIDISQRLISIADMVTPGNTFCDVGCDHGFLAIYLVTNKNAPSGIASDINIGPLSAAREHIKQRNLDNIIETKLSDGLANIAPNEAKTLIIAGMGGPLILKILEAHEEVTNSFEEIVISPQSLMTELRTGIRDDGFVILDENMVYEDGKFYPILRMVPKCHTTTEIEKTGHDNLNRYIKRLALVLDELGKNSSPSFVDEVKKELDTSYGELLILSQNKVFIDFLKKENKVNEGILSSIDSEKHKDRYLEVSKKQWLNRVAYEMCTKPEEKG